MPEIIKPQIIPKLFGQLNFKITSVSQNDFE